MKPAYDLRQQHDMKVKQEALQIIGLYRNLPRLVVFDLDHTLWPFFCNGCRGDEIPHLYPQAKGIILALREKGIGLAIASRSSAPGVATLFLKKLGIEPMFLTQEIYPTSSPKTSHFQRIHRDTGVPYSAMLFFDDEDRNIQAISKLGVTSILVNNGVNLEALWKGLSHFPLKFVPKQGGHHLHGRIPQHHPHDGEHCHHHPQGRRHDHHHPHHGRQAPFMGNGNPPRAYGRSGWPIPNFVRITNFIKVFNM